MTSANSENNEEEFEIIHDIPERLIDLPATFSDLVEVDGYDLRVFKVVGYRIEDHFTEEREWTELVFDLQDAVNGEWLEADSIDVELLADAEDADVYMQTVDYENYPKTSTYIIGIDFSAMGGGNMAGKERKLTARELSAKEAEERKQARKERAEAMDNELDRYNFFKRMYEKTGDRSYKESMDSVMDGIKSKAKEGE